MAGPVNRMLGATGMKGHEYVTGAASPQMDAPEYEPGRLAEAVDMAENFVDSALRFVKRHPFAIVFAGLGIAAVCLLGLEKSRSQRP